VAGYRNSDTSPAPAPAWIGRQLVLTVLTVLTVAGTAGGLKIG
jgi:hypothetical protein